MIPTLLVLVVAAPAEPVSFATRVRPILSDRCFVCHGPDTEQRQAGLRLDTAEGVATVVVAGDAAASVLHERIAEPDADLRMPPPDSHLSLTAEEIATIRRWIDEGADWQRHWSLRPLPTSVPVPDAGAGWGNGPIDRFVHARMSEAGLAPEPPARPERWLRRVTFDLTGLPPTLAELDAFLADPSPQRRAAVVDDLLGRTACAERLAADWLDVARYSDTYGYQVDRDRRVWPWRDWVVGAFGRNLPYDRFLTEQLAGDLLPGATDEQILATAFNRLHPQKVEGGSVPEEFRLEYVADRTHTVGTAFLGLTLECCRCHDHKYDPLSQRDYYRFSGFFDQIDEAGLYSYFTPAVPTPTLPLATADQKSQRAELRELVHAARARLEQLRHPAAGDDDLSPPPPLFRMSFDEVAAPNETVQGKTGTAAKLTGDDEIGAGVGNFRRWQPFTVAAWLKLPTEYGRAVVWHRSRAWTDAASRGYELLVEDGRPSAALIHFWPGNAIRVRGTRPLPTGRWVHVAMTYDGSSTAAGLRLYVDGQPAETAVVRDALTRHITGGGGDHLAVGARFRDHGLAGGAIDELCVFDAELSAGQVAGLHAGREPVAAATPAELADARAALADARKTLFEFEDGLDEIMVMRPLGEPRPTFVRQRGAYDRPGEQVVAGTPAALPPLDAEGTPDRLDLARWLTRPDHPLTARVAVNHYWQLVMGTGLMRTPEDFGSQSEVPTHPRLLDWLARDFVAHGWEVKRLLRQIVLSATYAQDSRPPADKRARDPRNQLLSYGPAHRLPAEMLRDNALAVGGLLSTRVGGPPAKPYEVAVSFKPAEPDVGEGLYRRSLYTWWKRTGPAPVMRTFDASKRDVCSVRRERTQSPLQALVLLNDPQFVEAARTLAERLRGDHPGDTAASLAEAFRLLTSRPPTDAERAVLRRLHDDQLARFAADPAATAEYLDVGQRKPASPTAELAALATVVNTLLGFDECVTRR